MDNINETHNEEYHHFYQVGTDESGDTVTIFIKNTAHHQEEKYGLEKIDRICRELGIINPDSKQRVRHNYKPFKVTTNPCPSPTRALSPAKLASKGFITKEIEENFSGEPWQDIPLGKEENVSFNNEDAVSVKSQDSLYNLLEQQLANMGLNNPPTQQKASIFDVFQEAEVIDNYDKQVLKQANSQSCSVTCAAMIVLDKKGELPKEIEEHIKNAKPSDDDSGKGKTKDIALIQETLQSQEIVFEENSSKDISSAQLPAIIKGEFFGKNKKLMVHWIVVDQVDGEYCYIRDPHSGTAARVQKKEITDAMSTELALSGSNMFKINN